VLPNNKVAIHRQLNKRRVGIVARIVLSNDGLIVRSRPLAFAVARLAAEEKVTPIPFLLFCRPAIIQASNLASQFSAGKIS